MSFECVDLRKEFSSQRGLFYLASGKSEYLCQPRLSTESLLRAGCDV